MCSGDRLVADFVAGTDVRPGLPEELEEHLTTTANGLWVVWAHKLARQAGDLFVRIERPTLSDRMEGVLGKRRHPGDPDGRPAVVPAATPRDSGPMRLNLPVSCPVLPVCHDDAGWCAGSSTFEHSQASLVLT